jgi:hypothetical protein
MSGFSRPRNWGVGVVVGVVLATTAFGQTPSARRAPRGRVQRMEIFDGTRQTVRYFSDNVSPGESSTLRDVERLENEMAYLNNLQALKGQYVTSERLLETHRRQVQRELYGLEKSRSSYGTTYVATGGYGYPSFGGLYGGYGYGVTPVGGDSSTVTETLADGVGPEGKIKEAMAMVMAQQASPEYAAKIDRAYDMALLQATASPTLRVALGVPYGKESRTLDDGIRRAGAETAVVAPVVLTLQDGEKVYGRKLSEKGDFYVVEKADGSEEVRKSVVMRIQRGRGDGVGPAIDR